MSIRLDFLKKRNYGKNTESDQYDSDSKTAILDDYVYRDIFLDLTESYRFNTKRLDATVSSKELKTLTDYEAIINSVKNILTTVPGQKLLNPSLGVNLGNLLFSPCTIEQARLISEVIGKELSSQEPRANIKHVHVVGMPSDNTYFISITVSVPTIGQEQLKMSGIVTVNGIKIERIESETIA